MPPDRDHFSGSVNLDDAESVIPGSELNFALVPYHPAGQARGTT